ncbi:MAG: WYL domain-containing protein [Prevotellaceae bacterium]|jgi:predicted DNA-binding transcriptional regulator YafY|nr:WYL domain-containing protein [Prevotellaceae bacterium]
MSKLETTKRYHLIIRKMRISKCVTFAEIDDYLQQQSKIQGLNFNISQRTFQRDIAEIGSIYGIYIKYNFSEKYYFIEEEFEMEINNRMFEALDVYNALNVKEQQSQYVQFERRSAQGTEHFYGILHAIRNRFHISFSYQKFYKNHPENRIVEPLILKEFKYRWYLVARDTYDARIKFYALDRLSDLEVQKTHYEEDTNFDINELMKYCFGIILPNDDSQPETVVLSFDAFQGKYIKSLPLHETQKILIDNEEELQISLQIYIMHDFIMELLSYGDSVKVISPQNLAEDLKEMYENALKYYL